MSDHDPADDRTDQDGEDMPEWICLDSPADDEFVTEEPEHTVDSASEAVSDAGRSDSTPDPNRSRIERAWNVVTMIFATAWAVITSTAVRASGAVWDIARKLRHPKRLLGQLKERALMAVLGPAGSSGTRIAPLLAILALGTLIAGVGFAVIAELDATAESSWFMERVIGTLTNVWVYAVLVGLAVALTRATERKRRATTAARKTGFTSTTVERLAAEARTTDGTSTVVMSAADTVEDGAERILSALETPLSTIGTETMCSDRSDRSTLDSDIVEAARDSAGGSAETTLVVDDRANSSASEHARLSRLELESALNVSDLFWHGVIPGAAAITVGLIAVQIWAAPWVYALLCAGGIATGAVWYGSTHYWRRRRAKAVRQSESLAAYTDMGVLVKKVETEDVTAYLGWAGGRVYADYDVFRFAWTLSEVAHAGIEGESIPPSIQQKFACELRQYRPNLDAFEDSERKEITDRLVQTVAETKAGRMPKNRLAETVVEQDRQRIGGIGYDPRLVADQYHAVVPYALVEDTARVDAATGSDTMTVVRLRTAAANAAVVETEAQFSPAYQPEYEPEFSLPEVDMTRAERT